MLSWVNSPQRVSERQETLDMALGEVVGNEVVDRRVSESFAASEARGWRRASLP